MKRISKVLAALTVMIVASCAHQLPSDAYLVGAAGADLEVELIIPEGGRERKPVVIFAGGSSPVDFRDYTPGFRETLIEEVFLPRDVAVMYVNKRGIGDSSGNWRWSSIEERAEDVLAVANHLRTLPNIDPEKVGIIGHSQGGWVVQLAGSMDPDIAFVVSLSGPTVSVREQDRHRVEIALRCEGRSDAEIAVALERLDHKHERNIRTGRWFPFFSNRYASNIYQFDPREAIQGLSQPTLLAFGSNDSLVPPSENYQRFDELFASTGTPDSIDIYTADGADHGFHVVESVCVTYEEALEEPYSTEFHSYLGTWVDDLGL